MRIEDIEEGMRVYVDNCAPEDRDSGIVHDIDHETRQAYVGWDSCQSSWHAVADLKPGPLASEED